MSFGSFSWDISLNFDIAQVEAELADYFARESAARPNDFTPTNPSVINTVNVAITPPLPTVDNLQPSIEYAQAIVASSVAEFGVQETPLVVTLLETLDDAGDLAGYLTRPVPAFWFGNIQVVMNGLTDAQRTTISSLDIGSQLSVTKSFPNSTPSTVTQVMALEGISHDITPDRHIVTLYPNPSRIYTHFIVGGYTTTTTRSNLVTNPNFETNTTGWGSAIGATNTRTNSKSVFGSWSISTTRTSTTGNLSIQTAPRISVTGGIDYTFSGYFQRDYSTTRTTQIRVVWYDASAVQIGSTISTTITPPAINTWGRFSTTLTSPANAATVFFDFLVSNAIVGETMFVDGVMLEASSTLLPYFDGTYADAYTGYTLTSQQWNGTANASTSTATWGLNSSFVGSELNDDTKGLG